MKICILSMQRVQNFGSLLQSYALKKLLTQMGHTVSFLDIQRNEADDLLLKGEIHEFSLEGDKNRGLVSKLKKLDKYTMNRLRIKIRAKDQDRLFERFRSSGLGMDRGPDGVRYDCCVIGSDEVFNCMSGSKWGFTSQLFGNVQQADRVITYAASCGATVLEELPEAAAMRIEEAFKNVSAFSVRDKNTKKMVSGLTEKPVEEHLDPVLIDNFEEELEAMELPENLPEKYCVVYSYYNRIHKEGEIEAIKAFCKKHELEIVTVGAPQMWVRNHLVLEPFQVLRVFENAAFVVTDTFHGTIFSAKYAERFAVMIRESNRNKLGDLLERLGVQKHMLSSIDQLEDVYAISNEKERVARLCAQERARTIQYLQENLLINK